MRTNGKEVVDTFIDRIKIDDLIGLTSIGRMDGGMLHRSTTADTRMMLVKSGGGLRILNGKAVEDLPPGPTEVTQRKFAGVGDGHKLLNGPAYRFKRFSPRHSLKRNNTTETRVIFLATRVGRYRAKRRGTMGWAPFPSKNKTLRSQLTQMLKTFFLTVQYAYGM